MNSLGRADYAEMRNAALPAGQLIVLLLLLGVGVPLVLTTIEDGAFSAVLVLCFSSVIGLLFCGRTESRLNDPSLTILGYFWLGKLGITLFLLYGGWIPELDPHLTSKAWGVDAQRFFFEAQDLVDSGWSPDLVSLNYVGILYYYGAMFSLFGHNPVVPALVNAFLTLIATLYLVKTGYEIKGQREAGDWILAFALFLPEVLWYDVATYRETPVAALCLLSMLGIGRYLARTAPLSLFRVLMVSGLSVVAIAAIRPSMVVPVAISIALMIVLIKPQRESRVIPRFILTIFVVLIVVAGPVVTASLGGYEFDLTDAVEQAASGSGAALNEDFTWNSNSIGSLLIPNGLVQSILFIPPRMVLYLVAPLPNLVTIGDVLARSMIAWQGLCTILSSMINVIAFPYALASLIYALGNRKASSLPLVLHIPYWVTFIAIAGGNVIVHERYRVMATLMFMGCAWLGVRTCPKRLVLQTSMLWYGLLGLGAVFYLSVGWA